MRGCAAELKESAVGADGHVKGIACVLVHLDAFVEEHFSKHFCRCCIVVAQVKVIGVSFIASVMVDAEAVHVREIKISASFQVGKVRENDGIIILSFRNGCHDLCRCFNEGVHSRHGIRKNHVGFLAHGEKDIVQRADGAYVVSVRMLMSYEKETVMGFQEIHSLLLVDFDSMIFAKTHFSVLLFSIFLRSFILFFVMHLFQETFNVHAVIKGLVFFEGNFRCVVNLEALAEFLADEAFCLVERFERFCLFPGFPEKADVNRCFAQISGHMDACHGDKADVRIFQVIEEHLADFLLDEFLYFSNA